uniref:Na-Ca exchanger/integrin-beta4-like protein n=1 Tax=Halisarca dujardinii TaxID=2583056 RepID=A0AA96S0V6_HALDU|nr:Na-Ca exchanger/integrin-beta4-like protein [Halisarca dujardinii]
MNTLAIALVLLTVYVSSSQAQILRFGPRFEIGRYDVTEGQKLGVRLSASILTHSLLTTGPFSSAEGEIEVDICIEDGTEEPLATPGSDYVLCDTVPGGNWTDRFTVQFVLRQANSSTVDICIGDDNIFEDTENFQLRICAVRFSESISGILGTATGFDSVTAPVEIDDNDVVSIHWERNSVTVTEGEDRQIGLRAVAEGVYARPISIGVQCSPVDSTNGRPASRSTDWIVTQTQLTFSSVDQLMSVSDVPLRALIVDDGIAEPQESFLCNLQSGNADPVKAVPPTQITVTIVDNDELIISWEGDFYEFRESETATVTLVTDSNFESDVVVNGFPSRISENRITLSLPGPTFEGFGQFPATINKVEFRGVRYGVARVAGIRQEPDVASTFDDFLFTSTIKTSTENFDIKNDDILEYDELLMAEFSISNLLEEGWLAIKGQFPICYIAIEDDDFVTVNFNQSEYVVNESARQVMVSLEITGQFFKNVSVTIECIDGNATVAVCRYEQDLYRVAEEAGYLEVALVLNLAASFPLSVNASTLFLLDASVGDAASVVDFLGINELIITFPPGVTRVPFNITIIDDNFPENSELFNLDVNLVGGGGDSRFLQIGSPKQPLVEIFDSDVAVNISLDSTTYSIFENEARVIVTLQLSAPYTQDIIVEVSLSENAAGVDFESSGFPRFVTIPAGQTSVSFPVLVIDEGIVEKDEGFIVSFSYTAGQPGVSVTPGFDQGAITIRNDDELRVRFERELYTVSEDAGSVSVKIIASSTASFDYDVNIAISDISAVFGGDYGDMDILGSGSGLVIPEPLPGVNRVNTTILIRAGLNMDRFAVIIIDDEMYESLESFHINLTVSESFQASNILEGDPIVSRVDIQDDDGVSVHFDPAEYEVREGENKVLILLANRTFNVPFDINVNLFDSSAVAPGDYEDRDYVVRFDVDTQMGMLVVHSNEDTILEDPELFLARLTVPSGLDRVVPGEPSEARVTITDRTPAEVFFDPVMYPIDEGEDANLTLRLTREVASGVVILVQFITRDGTAERDEDYLGEVYNVTFEGTNVAVVPVPSIDDDLVEGVEEFTAVIVVPADTQREHLVTRGSPDTAVVEINDNDMLMVFFDRERYQVNEDDRVATITLRSSKPHELPYNITVNGADGTAEFPGDYSERSFDLLFPAGATSVTFDIPIVDNEVFEGPEFFNLSIVIPQASVDIGVEPGMPIRAFVDILDDEVVNVFFDPTSDIVTEGEDAELTVRADRNFTIPFSVIVTLSDDSAVAPGDYNSSQSPYVLTFQPGQSTQTILVPTNDDTTVEMTELFTAALSLPAVNPTPGVVVIQPEEATVTIVDNEEPLVVVLRRNETVPEGQDALVLVEVSSTDYEFNFTVTLSTMDIPDSAKAPADYQPGPYTASFTAGQASAVVRVGTEDDDISELTEHFKVTIDSTSQDRTRVEIGADNTSFVAILDDDNVTCSFSVDSISVTEGESARVTIDISSADFSFPFTVTLSYMDGSAIEGEDYTRGNITVEFAPGQSSVSFDVPTIDDDRVEKLENFKIMKVGSSRPDKVSPASPDMVTIEITDNDERTLIISPQNYTVVEGQIVNITLVLDSDEFDCEFNVTLVNTDMSATAPEDYTSGPYTVTFQPNQTTAVLMIPTKDNSTAELTEVFKVEISSTSIPAQIVIGEPDDSYVTILDNDDVTCSFSVDSMSVTEGESARVTIDISSADFSFPFTVTLSYMDGSAVEGEDYTRGDITVEFAPGQSSASFNVSTIDDDRVEKLENFKIMKVNSSRPDKVSPASPDMVTIEIIDNDERTLSIIPQNYTVVEGQKVNITLVLDSDEFDCEFNVTLVNTDMSATAPEDYTSGPYTVTFQPGQTTAILMIPTEDDSIAELTEVFKVVINSTSIPAQILIGEPDDSYVTILDNDDLTCSFSDDSISVTEGESARVIIETSSADFSFPFTVTLSYMDGSAVEGEDYTSGDVTVEFTPGQSSVSFDVPTIDDDRVEKLENFKIMKVSSSRPDKVSPASPDMVTIEIIDNDERTLSIIPQNYTVVEGQIVNITLVLDSDEFDCEFNVTLVNTDMSATAPEDYTSGPYTVTFQPNQTTAIVMVPTKDDSTSELTEVFKVEISSTSIPAQIVIGEPDDSYVTIEDSDDLTCSFSVDSMSVTEGESARVTIDISSADFSFPFAVTLSYMDGSAVEGEDYTSGDVTVEFTPGQSSVSFDVPTIDDDRVEKLENFKIMKVSSSRPDKVSPASPDMVTIEIIDNDERTLSIIPQNYTVVEGQIVNITLVLDSDEFDCEFNVTLVNTDMSATAPEDYTSGPYTVTFQPNQTTAIVMVPTKDDSTSELTEVFKVEISSTSIPAQIVIGEPDDSYVTIEDNDDLTCSFSVDSMSVTEGESARVTIDISSADFSFPFTVTLSYMDGSAVEGEDYTRGDVTVEFAPGQSSASFDVSTIDDDRVEKLENFKIMKVNSSRPDKVSPTSPDMVTIEITDNDERTLSIIPQNYTVVEGQKVNITLVLDSDEFDCEFNVTLVNTDMSATAPEDYTSGPYTVTFQPNQTTAILMIPTEDDSIAELTEVFKVEISSTSIPDQIVTGEPDDSYVTILDNDVIECSKAPENATVTEGEVASLTIVCSGEYEFDFTLNLDSMDDSAVAPGDYNGGPYSVVFTAGQQSAILSVPTNDDSIAEMDQVFKVMITGSDLPDKVIIVQPDTCYVTIEDDDDVIECSKAPENATVTEGEVASLTIVCIGEYEFDFTLNLDSMDDSAVAPGDYVGGPYSVVFTAGQQSAIFSVPTNDDSVAEMDQVFKVMITGSDQSDKVVIAQPDTCYVTIEDDDDVIECSKAPENATVTEGQVASLTIVCSGEYEFDFTLNLDSMDDSAVSPGDYVGGPYSVVFTAGQQSAILSVPTNDDSIAEMDQVFNVIIAGSDQSDKVIIVQPDTCFVTIKDNDVIECAKAPQNATVTEGEVASLTIVCSGEYEFDFTLNLDSMDDSAVAPGDYVSGPYSVVFNAGQQSAILSVPTNDDSIAEMDQVFKVMITGSDLPDKVIIVQPDRCYVTIQDDNDVIECSKAPENATVTEGEVASLTIVCSGEYEFDFTLNLNNMDDSAVAPADYRPGPYSVFFTAGTEMMQLNVDTLEDSIAELKEEFKVMITGSNKPGKVVIEQPDTCYIWIEDNDKISVSFETISYVVLESNNASITVVTDPTMFSFPFTVIIRTMNITATGNEDYVSGDYTVTFKPNQARATFVVPTIQDTISERNEVYKVTIVSTSQPDQVMIGDPDVANVTILDDEELTCIFSQPMYSVTEGEIARITIDISSADFSFPFTVTLSYMDGSAVEGEDYTRGDVTVEFAPGQNSTSFDVPTIDDDRVEKLESFKIMKVGTSEPLLISPGPQSMTTVQIVDNDVLMVSVVQNYTVAEGETAPIVVEVDSIEFDCEFNVTLLNTDDTAKSPGDYTPGPYVVNFQPGQRTVTLMVPTVDDSIAELTEVFNVMIASTTLPMKVLISERNTSFVEIEDSDVIECSKAPENATVTEGQEASLTIVCSGEYEFDFTLNLDSMDDSAVAPGDYVGGPYSVVFTAGQESAILSVPTNDDSIAEMDQVFKVMITGSDQSDKVIIVQPDTCYVTIEDNDVIECSKAPENATVTEGEVASLTIECSGEYEFDFTLNLDSMDDSAIAPGDYVSGPYSVDFTAGQQSAILSVLTNDDSIAEMDQVFKVMITGSNQPLKVIIAQPDTCYVTIEDDDDVIECSKAPENATVTEGEVASLTIVCSGEYEFDFTLNLDSMDDSAVAPGDYVGGPYTVVFNAGKQSAILPVPTNDDSIAEMDQVFKVMITGSDLPDKVIIAQPDTCYVTIEDDNDVVTCRKAAENITVTEGQLVNVTIECSGEYEFDFTLDVATLNGTAFAPGDYEAGVMNVLFSAGETSRSVSVVTIDDSVIELEEFFKLMISGSDQGNKVVIAEPGMCFVIVRDNDGLSCFFSDDSISVTEGESARVTIETSSADFSFPFTVTLSYMDGSAVEGEDYTRGNITVEFVPGQNSVSFDVPTIEDGRVEKLESFKIMKVGTSEPDKVSQGTPSMITVEIEDDDERTLIISPQNYTVVEGQKVNITLVLDSDEFDCEFNVTLVNTDITTAPEDYTSGPYTVTFQPGQTTAILMIPTEDDSTPELTEVFKVEISSTSIPAQIVIGEPDDSYVTILDNDDVTCSFSVDSMSVTEGESARVTIDISSADFSFPFTVTLSYMDGSAVEGEDYTSGDITVEFVPGQSSVSFDVPTIDDDRVEKLENFKIMKANSSRPDKVSPTSPDTVTIEITDNDERTLSIIPQNYTVVEGQKVNITLVLDSDEFDCEFNVTLVNTDMSATAPEDYTSGPYTVTFQPGQTTAILMIPTEDDSIAELTEVFKVEISSTSIPAQILIGEPDDSYVTILDNDVIECSKAPENATVTEGQVASLTIVCSGEYEFEFTLNLDSMDDSAVAPGDYIGGPYSVVFTAGQQSAILSVPTNDDSIAEMDQVFKVMITGSDLPDKVIIAQPDTCYVTIEDDNDVVTCRKAAENITVTEGQLVNVTVECSGEYEFDFTLDVATMDGTAFAPGDYEAGVMNVLFSAGETSKSVSVVTIDDSVIELEEFFKLMISGSDKGDKVVIAEPRMCFVIIRDNDGLSCFFSDDSISVTEGESARVTIETSSADFSFPFTVTLSYMDGSAVEGEDYTRGDITVEFVPGQNSVSFEVPTIEDGRVEKLESFKIMKVGTSEPDKVSQGTPSMITVEIEDDDERTLIISPQNYTVVEGQKVNITLVLDSDEFDCEFNVTLVNTDMSATAPEDYTSGPYTVTFQPNQTTAILMIPTEDDSTAELTEVFKVEISSTSIPDQIVTGEPDDSYVTIQDNDVIECSKAPENATVTEGQVASLTIVCSGEYEFDFTLNLDSMDDSAVAPGDYNGGPYSVVFTAGQQSAILSVPTNDDSIAEMDQVFKVMITGSDLPDKVIIAQPDTCFVTIEDDDDVIECSKAPENATLTEGEVASLTIECSGEYEFDFTLNLDSMDDSAIAPGDYVSGPYSVDFTAGQQSAILSVLTNDDSIAEMDQVFKVMITGSNQPLKVIIAQPDTCYVTIEDDDDVIECSKAPENATVTEGEVASLTIVCSGEYEFDFTLNLDSMDDSAVAPGDYVGGPYSVVFNAGKQSAILPVPTNDDSIAEMDQVFKVMITGSDLPDKVIIAQPDTCYVTIEDDNDVVTCRKAAENITVTEGQLVNVTIECSGEYEFDFTLDVATMDGSAVAPGDYEAGVMNVLFSPGETSRSVSVVTIDDSVIELEEFFKLMISGSDQGNKVVIAEPRMCFVIVRDNDGLSCFFSDDSISVTEGESARVTIETSSADFSFPFTVTLSYMDGSAVEGEDYTRGNITVEFAPGQSSASFDVPTIDDDRVEKLENFKIMKVGTSESDKVSQGTPSMITVEIQDNDVLVVMFQPDDYQVAEGETATVSLITNLAYSFNFTVNVVCENGTAFSPDDFTDGMFTAEFLASPNEAGRASIQVQTIPDNVFEALEFFKCSLIVPDMDMDNVVSGQPDMARVNITDNTGADCFFNPDVYLINEGSNATIIVETSVTVAKRFSCIVTTEDDSANSPSDYISGTKVAIFEIGSTSAEVVYRTVFDEIREGLESFRARLSVSEPMMAMGVRAVDPELALVDIIDDDELFVMFERNMYMVTEGNPPPEDGLLNVTIIATRQCEDPYTLNIVASDGSATEGEDYRGQSFTVTIPALTTAATFSVPIINDLVFESDETFFLQIEAPQNRDGECRDVKLGSPDRATVLIKNDEPVVTIEIEESDLDVVENENMVEVCLVKSGPSTEPIMAMLIVEEIVSGSGDSNVSAASENDDFSPVPVPDTLTIPPNVTRMCFDVLINDDPMVERTEPFKITVVFPPDQPALQNGELSIASGDNGTITGTINIQDDDNITIEFEFDMYMRNESDALFEVSILASGSASFPYSFEVSFMNIEAVEPFDYVFIPLTRIFEPGQTSTTFSVPIVDDNFDEIDESFKLIITIPESSRQAGVSVGVKSVTTLIIKDNDVPEAVFNPQNYSVPEGSNASITVVLDKIPVKQCTVTVTTVDLSAEGSVDYTPVVRDLIFMPNQSSVTFAVPTILDGEKEQQEFFRVDLTTTDDECVVGTPAQAFVRILDDSVLSVQFEREMYMTFEVDGMVEVRIIASSPSDFAYDIVVSSMDIEAIDPDDYTFPDMTLTFAPGEVDKLLSIPVFPDMLDERNETFKLTITIPEASGSQGVQEGDPITAVVLIKDSDVPEAVFNPQNYSVPEGSAANITVVLDKIPIEQCTVTVTTVDLSAEDTLDYSGVVAEVVFPAGQTSATFSVNTLGDVLLEGDEHFKVVLSAGDGGCSVGSPDEAFVTVQDQQVDVIVRFNPDTYVVTEGQDGNAVISLEADGEHGFDFVVMVRAMDGFAIIDEDYEGDLFSVLFPANVNTASFNLSILDDQFAESPENLTLKLEVPADEAAKGVQLGSPDVALVTILDDDDLVISFVVPSYTVKENVGTVTVEVIASRPANFDYSVTVRTAEDTAMTPEDFEDNTFTVNFPAGSTQQSFDVVITDDNILEEMESLDLQLSISDDLIDIGVQVGSNGRAVINIMDNDLVVRFRRPEVSVPEENERAPVEVLALGDLSMDFSIIVMAINGSAIENLDFIGNMWMVDFPSAVSSQSFFIPIVQDAVVEDTELFTLKIVVSDELSRRLTVASPEIMTVIITDLVNDTVIGDPLFTVPLPSLHIDDDKLKGSALCFEYHGHSGEHYNLISDSCVSVNTLYSAGVNKSKLNVMSEIGIRAEDSAGGCHTISVLREGCSASLNGAPVTGTVSRSGVVITARRSRVRVSLPNCESQKRLTLWVLCNRRNDEDMLEIVVSRGDGLRPTAHGLIGQFWNVPIGIEPYTGVFDGKQLNKDDGVYLVHVAYPGSQNRTFVAEFRPRAWDSKVPCLYAGNSMAGPMAEAPQYRDNVIDGAVNSYNVDNLFTTDYQHSKYKSDCN